MKKILIGLLIGTSVPLPAAERLNLNIDLGDYKNIALGAGLGLGTALTLSYLISPYLTYNSLNDTLDYLELKGRWASHASFYWKKNYLVNTKITDDNMDTVLQETGAGSSDFPLITIVRKLQQYEALFEGMRNMSDKLLRQTQMFNYITFRKTSAFYQKLEAQRERLEALIKRVRDNIAAVKKYRDWNEQWKMYQTRDTALEKTNILIKGVKDIVRGNAQ